MKYNRFFPLAIPSLVFALQELYFFYPKLIYLALALANLLIFFTVWQFCQASKVDRAWWNYMIMPALMTSAIFAYSIFLNNKFFVQLLFVFNLIFLYLYWRQVYYYLLLPLAYEVFSIENLSSYINWLAFFLFSATIYGVQTFLNLPVSWLALLMLAITALIIYQIIWANKISIKSGLPYILIDCLLLVELLWSISFLPFNYNISGACLAICYYVIIGLTKNHLLDKLDSKKVKMYLLLGSACLLLLMFTAKWL